jgi:hypothetical protein
MFQGITGDVAGQVKAVVHGLEVVAGQVFFDNGFLAPGGADAGQTATEE